MMGEKRTESLLVALAVSGVLVFSLTPSPRLRFGVSRLPALHRIYQCQGQCCGSGMFICIIKLITEKIVT
jgi:hypothetical protein